MIADFVTGDEAAVRAVYQCYGGAIQTIARSVVPDPELSKEVVQQTFLKAWRSAGSFDTEREFAPWLYAIARRTAIDVLRTQRRSAPAAELIETAAEDGDYGTMSLERTWEIHEVRQAIDQLPQVERETIRLSHMVGLSHPEIAERLGVPVGTVKSRSARGHARLGHSLRHLSQAANQRQAIDVQEGEE